MTGQADLAIIRRAYAKQVAFAAGTEDPRIIEGLATLLREDFVTRGPWLLGSYGEQRLTPDADPTYVYQDLPIPILPDKDLNNGQPSFVTKLIGLCALQPGDRVTHIGIGTGYFTSLIARLVGPSGHVLGIEIEPDLARRASRNLASFANTRVVADDGWTRPLDPCDAILVNAGTPRFAATWLDALNADGRLVVPLATTSAEGTTTTGAIFRIARDANGFAASATLGVSIYACAGAGDPEADAALRAALAAGGAKKVTRLRRDEDVAEHRCWLRGPGWCLTYG